MKTSRKCKPILKAFRSDTVREVWLQECSYNKEQIRRILREWENHSEEDIATYWQSRPSLVLNDILRKFNIIPESYHVVPGQSYPFLIRRGFAEARDILFWGSIFNEDGTIRTRLRYRSIAELEPSHIRAILNEKHTENPFYLVALKDELKSKS